MPGPTDLYDLAAELRDAAAAALDTIPAADPELDGAPAIQVVTPGLPALDCCPALMVHIEAQQEAPTGPLAAPEQAGHRAEGFSIIHPKLVITIARCGPTTVKDATVANLQAAARQTHADLWAIWNYLISLKDQELISELCSAMHWDGAIALDPQGGCVGWVIRYRIALDGYYVELP